ncbi:MAG TPA: tetratricopeptide repeat protein [Acidobacteriaceae bacterium]|nr:tetratricopeptide repeat protein [Acidobacteriaceae bacterium]
MILAIALMVAGPFCSGQTAADSSQRDAAFALEQQGRNVEAEAAWRKILESQPNDAEAYAHLGFLESRQQHYSQAILFYRKASALNPSMPGLQLNLGLALFKAGEMKAAVRVFEPLLRNQPPDSPGAQRLRILLGMAHYGVGEYADAVPYLRAAMSRDPQNLPYRLVLAESCLRSEQYQCVLDVYHQILMLNAESAEADMLAGEALDAMRDHAGAIQQFRAAVKADPKEPGVHFGLGYLLWTQNQFEEAAQQFQLEVDNTPNDAQALAYLADSNVRLNRPEVARPMLEEALRLNPRQELPYLDLGILDAAAGQNEEALREFKAASRLSPDDVQVHWRLARLYQSMGRREEAKAEFAKTKNLNKTADETVLTKLGDERAKNKPGEATTAVPHSSEQPDE